MVDYEWVYLSNQSIVTNWNLPISDELSMTGYPIMISSHPLADALLYSSSNRLSSSGKSTGRWTCLVLRSRQTLLVVTILYLLLVEGLMELKIRFTISSSLRLYRIIKIIDWVFYKDIKRDYISQSLYCVILTLLQIKQGIVSLTISSQQRILLQYSTHLIPMGYDSLDKRYVFLQYLLHYSFE